MKSPQAKKEKSVWRKVSENIGRKVIRKRKLEGHKKIRNWKERRGKERERDDKTL